MRLIDADALIKEMERWDWQELYLPIHFKELLIDEAPTIEPSGDLISREDALRELNGACSNWQDDSKVADIISAMPSASDLISREDARKAFSRINDLRTLSLGKIGEVLDALPTADRPSIVRCGECKHRYYADNRVPHEKTWVCERFMNEEITSNDFCSWGERKGGDSE